MRTKVKTLRTHQSMFAFGWGDLKNVLPPPSKTFPGLEMIRAQEGVEVSSPGKISFLVPWGNIVLVELFEEDKTKS